MASKKPKVTITYEPEDMEEIKAYATAKKLSVPALMKFTLQQYMDRYPGKSDRQGAKKPQGVHPEASEARSDQRAG